MYCIDIIQTTTGTGYISYMVLVSLVVALGAEGLRVALGPGPIQRDRDQTIGTKTDIPCPRTRPDPGLVLGVSGIRTCGTGIGTGTSKTFPVGCVFVFWSCGAWGVTLLFTLY